MKEFKYINAPDLRTALNVLDREREQARLVAGATNIMVDIRAGKLNELTLVNIRDIAALRGIKQGRGKIVVGPLTTINELALSPIIIKHAPTLAMAAADFADATTRNSATIGGNIANASPAADTAPPLLALKANIIIERKGVKRVVSAEDFFIGVNKTVLQANEMITAIEFAPNAHSAFYKIGLRNAMAISVVTAACAINLGRGGVVNDCAIALGSVAPKPVRAYQAEKLLIGQKPEGEALEKALLALDQDIRPIDDIRSTAEYRRDVAPVIVKRVLMKACGICANEEAGAHEGRS